MTIDAPDLALAPADRARLALALSDLAAAGLSGFAVTGGVAIGAHLAGPGRMSEPRPLHDLDLVVAQPAALPGGLAGAFLVSHVHPDAGPGRMALQLVHPGAALRIDVFGARGDTLARCRPAALGPAPLALVSPEDLASRLAAVLLDLSLGEAVPAKHARDFAALRGIVDPAACATAWADHRRPRHPAGAAAAFGEVARLTAARADLLVARSPYRPADPCPSCRALGLLRPSPAAAIVAALGHR